MFMNLDPKELDTVIDAMDKATYKGGDPVIKEGDAGDVLFIVETGKLSCTKVINGKETFLKEYHPGEVFGELALLYNAPRAASITADNDSFCWLLDRATFNHIVKDAAQKKREKYEDFLSTVPILSQMDRYERAKIADCIKETPVAEGDVIIKQGDSGDTFYILVEGACMATLDANPGVSVMDYKPADFFGELALLKGDARAANVIAKTDSKIICLDRKSFKRLLGPLEKILARNMSNYLNYLKKWDYHWIVNPELKSKVHKINKCNYS